MNFVNRVRPIFGHRSYSTFLDNINKMKIDRKKLNISPEILNIDQVNELCEILSKKKVYKHSDLFLDLFKNRISPGVDETSKVKASFLNNICKDVIYSPYINKEEAVKILGTMQGGYNIEPLIDMLSDKKLGELAAKKLSNLILIFDYYYDIERLYLGGNKNAKTVIESWANAEWFLNNDEIEEKISICIFKVPGETNTDD